jgi:hypothetical protein
MASNNEDPGIQQSLKPLEICNSSSVNWQRRLTKFHVFPEFLQLLDFTIFATSIRKICFEDSLPNTPRLLRSNLVHLCFKATQSLSSFIQVPIAGQALPNCLGGCRGWSVVAPAAALTAPLSPHPPPLGPALSALLLPSTSNHQGCAIDSWYPLLCSSALLTSANPGSSPRSLLPHSVADQRQAEWSNILPHHTSRDPGRAAQHMDHTFAAQLV